ncbi:MAG: ABC transporter ATP-binding protein [Planctomycetes bacterium]|nr:ABC transporter ATP-binding protein [Planctomycetota bacterium]
MSEILLDVKNLSTYFYTDDGVVKAVENVSFSLEKGQTLGLVGESGCGKSVSSYSIMQLIPMPPGKIVSGEILFRGQNLLKISEKQMRRIRGNDIAMIFQEPMTSLNPVYTVGDQIIEAIKLHQKLNYRASRVKAIQMLDKVGIPSPDQRIDEYPHQMSGGMKQRVMIAMALSCNPDLLIADEPTTALDVTIQAQILDLMLELQNEYGMSILFITHDLGVIAQMADEIAVMYASHIVEKSSASEIFKNPRHPYTIGLFNSIPRIGTKKELLDVIPGTVPNPLDFPDGCKFNPRCFFKQDKCVIENPQLELVADRHECACRFWKDISPEKWHELAEKINERLTQSDLL